ncbi:hypothetical protein DFP72DRAFT_550533 [Ephemerocybe angulata]|uniref:Uncharacterized protein n=1 Tax=Ephemerocybe angulata TaxID=980116 RepID=A0A8H6HM73_9AGAR|nr:hypothetical protein DFP72DRAFT_550533 [Tulosesus angulatus]
MLQELPNDPISLRDTVNPPIPAQWSSRPGMEASSSSSTDLERSTPTITDADDSIVLSDIVRTGEASRLRRRGALRLDRNSLGSHHRHLSFDSEFDDHDSNWSSQEEGGLYHRGEQSTHSRWTSGDDEDDSDDEYVLVCGAEMDPSSMSSCSSDGYEPFRPSILPVEPTNHTRRSSYSRPTNGCGAILHLSASPSIHFRRGHGNTYIARGRATETVVPLSTEYFDSWPDLRFENNACGCIKEGVGCSACGNPLGTRWKFCKVMAERQEKILRRTSGRRRAHLQADSALYRDGRWAASGPSRDPCPLYEQFAASTHPEDPDSGDEAELFTFFSSAVTPRLEHVNAEPSRQTLHRTLSAKPSQEWPTGVTLIPEPSQPPEFDWLRVISAHHARGDREVERRNAYPVAINVQVSVESSVSYTDQLRSDSESESTSIIEGPRRPTLFPSRSAPATYGYPLTDSPESIASPLPPASHQDVFEHPASDPSSSAPSSPSSFGYQQPVTIFPVGDSPLVFSTPELSDDVLPAPSLSFYESQVLGAEQREQEQGLRGEWLPTQLSVSTNSDLAHADDDSLNAPPSEEEEGVWDGRGMVLFGH